MATPVHRFGSRPFLIVSEILLLLTVLTLYVLDIAGLTGTGLLLFFFCCIFPYQTIVNFRFASLESRIRELEGRLQKAADPTAPQPA